jgi:transposase
LLKHQAKERLDQIGCKFLRDALYMPALVTARFNPDLRNKYQAMIKAGKPPKVAITAIMGKILAIANALIKQNQKWTLKTA